MRGAFDMGGRLYVVGTPIGNLSDMSPRALETLEAVDFLAVEDTRVTVKLLNRFEIKKPMVSYYEHNMDQRGAEIVARLLAGEQAAIVTDAGMPCISDPGERLVALCAEAGIPIAVVPGPSAVTAALALSGLPVGRFSFEGFLSVKKTSRLERLEEIKGDRRAIVFYEAPHKLIATLSDLYAVLGDRRIALARELTKVYEEVQRTTLSQAVAHYETNEPRGEYVLVVEGASRREERQTIEEAAACARTLILQGESPAKAAKQAARTSGQPRGEIYRLLMMKERDEL